MFVCPQHALPLSAGLVTALSFQLPDIAAQVC